jgi:hypothetical protein
MADQIVFFFNTLFLIASHCDLLDIHEEYSYMYGHWALYREKWPEEVST